MSITRPLGFLASASKAGIKPSGKPDVALIVRELIDDAGDRQGTAMAFTRNQLIGAPVLIGRELRRRTLAGDLSPPGVVLINAGNSNAATGEQGIADARRTCEAIAKLLARPTDSVIPSSTGVIGRLLPVQKIVDALPTLVDGLARGDAADLSTAQAIMTTDNVHKSAFRSLTIDGFEVHLGAIAKGAGMIAPRLDSASRAATPSATMLAFITTDAAINSNALQQALDNASDNSFNRITVDNHASCSDTVIAMSSGLAARAAGGDSAPMPPLMPGSPGFLAFSAALA
ncbi:MAG: bifunctional ornithine acetyltransferase/N-acetylglutamate synthase, partial [Phycisphaerales bacterium]|nr:bifunctional ornithine acetyltransferase/N-acetylglutamate synthase [Phycisphaerales bacterium]